MGGHMAKGNTQWEGRETFEWWWGGSCSQFDRVVERDENDDNVYEPNNW